MKRIRTKKLHENSDWKTDAIEQWCFEHHFKVIRRAEFLDLEPSKYITKIYNDNHTLYFYYLLDEEECLLRLRWGEYLYD